MPAPERDATAPLSARIFKIDRGAAGEKLAYVSIDEGTLHVRERVLLGHDCSKVTSLSVFTDGDTELRQSAVAGEIAKVSGFADAKIGDSIGSKALLVAERSFPAPTLETIVTTSAADDNARLFTALTQLAEQDPLIALRQSSDGRLLFVSLYGEVQKEVIDATLRNDFGIAVAFSDTTPICIERPVGRGVAGEALGDAANPFVAGIELVVEPGPLGSGIELLVDADVGSLPIYIYKSIENVRAAFADYVCETLSQGLHGWEVRDCRVRLTACEYASPVSSAADYRKLTPLVLMQALAAARTVVCEPIHDFHVEGPADSIRPVTSALAHLRAVVTTASATETSFTVEGEIAAARMHVLQQELGSLTHGEGVVEFEFSRYEPVGAPFPTRPRSDLNPLNRAEYFLHLNRRIAPTR